MALGSLVIAYPSGEFERSLESFLASFPGWLDPVWDFCYSLLALWAVPRRRPGRASALCLSLTPSSASSSPTSRNDDDFVFPARNGLGPLAYWNFRDRDWVETLKLAGLNDRGIKIHDLRHACAGLLISQGLSPADVANHLGHSQVTTTLNTYSHLFNREETHARIREALDLTRSS